MERYASSHVTSVWKYPNPDLCCGVVVMMFPDLFKENQWWC
jgi:hypothetical protein